MRSGTRSVRGRMLLTYLALACVLLFPAAYAASQLARLRRLAVDERSRHASATLALGRFQAGLSDLDRYARSYIAVPDPELGASMRGTLDSLTLELARLTEFGYGSSADSLRGAVDGLQAGADTITRLVEAGRLMEASDVSFERLRERMAVAAQLLHRVGETVDVRSRADFQRAREISDGAALTTLVGAGLALLLAALVSVWATRALVHPLRRLRDGMAEVGEGGFDAPPDLPYARADEIGDLARSFRWMTERLAELDRMKEEFMGFATHELKNPINVIGGYASLVKEGALGEVQPDQRDALHAIEEQTRILGRLVNRMLQIGRLEAGAYPVHPQPIEPRVFLDSVRRSFAVLARTRGIRLEIEGEPSMPPSIHLDPDVMRDEVIGNLISNSLKYTPRGGDISLRGRGEEGDLVLELSDSGPGIPSEQRDRIFEKYAQAERPDRDLGTGLGLAIAREVVQTHGGRITIEDVDGRGAAFRIRIPAQMPETDAPASAEAAAEGSPAEHSLR